MISLKNSSEFDFANFEPITTKLFKIYRFREFNLTRNDIFNKSRNIAKKKLLKYESYLLKKNEISIIPGTDYVKFNIQTRTMKYLSHDKMIPMIYRILKKFTPSGTTSSKLNKNFSSQRRFHKNILEFYLEDLVVDGYLYKKDALCTTFYDIKPLE